MPRDQSRLVHGLLLAVIIPHIVTCFSTSRDGATQIKVTSQKACTIHDLDIRSKPSEKNHVMCTPEYDVIDGTVQDQATCTVTMTTDEGNPASGASRTILKRCHHGIWIDGDTGIKRSRRKRWFDWFGTVIPSCPHICEAGSIAGEIVNSPPTFSTPCRPAGLQATFYVTSGQTSVTVTWSDPTAQDSDGIITSLIQTAGSGSGSRFSGQTGTGNEHHIVYKVTDNDGLSATCSFSFVVIIPQCSALSWPENGQVSCTQATTLGSVCTYSCNSGYQITGSSQVTCQGGSSPVWSSTPTCEKIACGLAPPSVSNGVTVCPGTSYVYSTVCHVSCNIGYAVSGTAYTQCQADGTWSSLDSTSCLDSAPPELSCLSPQIFYTDRHSTTVSVSWTPPTAMDASDPNPTVTQTEGQPYGSLFSTGSSFVKYKAVDNLGRESQECTIEIRVTETTCPDPALTLDNAHLSFSCTSNVLTYGTECTLTCTSNYPSIGTDRITCERNDSSNPSVATWSWGDGTKPSCDETTCPALDPPANGQIELRTVGTDSSYTMVCNAGYSIPHIANFGGQFVCQTGLGSYTPAINVPDCVASRSPGAVVLPGEILYHDGACADTATEVQVLSTLQQIIENVVNPSIRALCPSVNNCTVTDLTVTCNGLAGRRRKRSMGGKPLVAIARDKRQTSPTMFVDFNILSYLDQTIDALTALDNADTTLEDIVKPQIEALVNNGTFDLASFTLQSDAFQTPPTGGIDCLVDGHILKAISCVPCPAAYYHDTTTGYCELCPLGFYSGEAALASCTGCPAGYTTLETGAKSESQCIEQCPAGSYSSSGTVPCTSCQVGYYQNGTGQTSCVKCTTGTTESTGSVSSAACQAFQLFVNATDGPVTVGNLSSDMTHVSLGFWTKAHTEMAVDASIKLKSGGNDRIIISLGSTIQVEMPGTAFNKNIGTLSSATWSHVVVTWDTTANDVLAYVGGPLHSSETFVTPPSSPLVSGGTIQIQSSGSSGVYIADLHIEDAVFSTSEISAMTSNCLTDRPGDLFGMDDFRDNQIQGIVIQTPVSCDPTNECDPDPCNGHTCVTGTSTYTCYCSAGWSGDDCTLPPNFCSNHACANGATCVNGSTDYTCTCVAGYSGDICDIPPVDGGLSEWSEWSACSVTCGGGTRTRSRSCDSPTPGVNGASCAGITSDSQACNQNACPTCSTFGRSGRVAENCVTDDVTGTRTCNVHCADGYALPDNLADDEYTCGLSTGYTWMPMSNFPDCVEPTKPLGHQVTMEIQYTSTISPADETSVKQAITNNLAADLLCQTTGVCTSSVNIVDSKRKRNTGSRLILTLNVVPTDMGALNIQNYIATSTASSSFQELIDAIISLEEAATYIITAFASLFDVTVNGATYTTSQSTLAFTGNVTCPTGQVATNGVCAPCPDGTYYTNGYCRFCEKGTYSTSIGLSSCTACPAGESTPTIGSYDASQCTVETTTTSTNTASTTGTPIYIPIPVHSYVYVAIVVSVVTLAVVMAAGIIYLVKKQGTKSCRVTSATGMRNPPRQLPRQNTAISLSDVDQVLSDNSAVAVGTYSGVEKSNPPTSRTLRMGSSLEFNNPTYTDFVRPALSPPPPYQ